MDEVEPDVRFTYANERTFLAWNRTALALIATGVAATQLLPEFHVADGEYSVSRRSHWVHSSPFKISVTPMSCPGTGPKVPWSGREVAGLSDRRAPWASAGVEPILRGSPVHRLLLRCSHLPHGPRSTGTEVTAVKEGAVD